MNWRPIVKDISFEGQVAIVTGAGRGLGRAYATGLGARGAAVVVNDIAGAATGSLRPAEAVVQEIVKAGGKAVASYDSVQTAAGGQAIVERAVEQFGSIDIVVNNAGFLRSANFEDV